MDTRPEGFGPVAAAVILAGGRSERMGRDKADLPFRGETLVSFVARRAAGLFPAVYLSAAAGCPRAVAGCETVADVAVGMGPLAGVATCLERIREERAFFVACDMPLFPDDAVRLVCEASEGFDACVPESPAGLEPLFAVYSKACLPAIEKRLRAGQPKMTGFLDDVRCRRIVPSEFQRADPGFLSFGNANTPEEYHLLRP